MRARINVNCDRSNSLSLRSAANNFIPLFIFILVAAYVVTAASRSGFSVTAPMGDPSRVLRDHRAGLRSRAVVYSAWRAARIA